MALDDVLVNRDWGFDLESIEPRIDVWHGDADVNVPLHAGEYLCDRLPNARTTFLPGAGHLLVLARCQQILSALAA
ncbi:MAG: alpha/beta fold hydrolase [Anaerolineae bacterium]